MTKKTLLILTGISLSIMAYMIYHEKKNWEGIGYEVDPETLDKKELEAGTQIEMEHTDDEEIARRIAIDHLTEDPKYYTHLIEMERKYKRKKK